MYGSLVLIQQAIEVYLAARTLPFAPFPNLFLRNLTAKLHWQDPEELPVPQIVEPPDSVQQQGLGRRLMGQGG